MKPFLCILTLVSTLTLAQAQNFLATLDVAQEVPTGGGRTGSGLVTLTLTGLTLSFSGSFSGLSSPWTADHIHGNAGPGVNVGVLYSLIPFTSPAPNGVATAGTINGSVTITAAQVPDLNAGLWYVNVHSATFGGGEIRGQILPVPEPGMWALGGLGLLGLLVWKRRK